MTYQAPPTDGSGKNFVKSTGQAIALPSGKYRGGDAPVPALPARGHPFP
ncbi:hypothetical protein [Streptomyces sp. NPDC088923]